MGNAQSLKRAHPDTIKVLENIHLEPCLSFLKYRLDMTTLSVDPENKTRDFGENVQLLENITI